MKNLFFIFFKLWTFVLFSQNKCDTIKWDSKVFLKVEDFKAPEEDANNFRAISNVKKKYKYFIKKDSLFFIGYTYFFKPKSRFNIGDTRFSESQNKVLLSHEQGHFDIAEVCLRLLKKKLSDEEIKSIDSEKSLKEIILKYEKLCEEMQQKYDDETKFSINKDEQEKWDKYIKKMLKDLESYNSDLIIVKLR